MRVAGIDGCKDGWVAVVVEDGGVASARTLLIADLERELDALGADLALIDVPIGLGTRDRPRRADGAARAALPGRASSVFPAPSREALVAETHREACDLNVTQLGKMISQQAFAIRGKIAEVDALVGRRPDLALREGHPEVSFAAQNGRPMAVAKKDKAGRAERQALLAGLGFVMNDARLAADRAMARAQGFKVGDDDLLDAAILAWSAERVAEGRHQSFPDPGETDATGRPMAILA